MRSQVGMQERGHGLSLGSKRWTDMYRQGEGPPLGAATPRPPAHTPPPSRTAPSCHVFGCIVACALLYCLHVSTVLFVGKTALLSEPALRPGPYGQRVRLPTHRVHLDLTSSAVPRCHRAVTCERVHQHAQPTAYISANCFSEPSRHCLGAPYLQEYGKRTARGAGRAWDGPLGRLRGTAAHGHACNAGMQRLSANEPPAQEHATIGPAVLPAMYWCDSCFPCRAHARTRDHPHVHTCWTGDR